MAGTLLAVDIGNAVVQVGLARDGRLLARWELASTPAATEAFRESMSPFMGMAATMSHFSFTSRPTPSPSFPMTSPIGPFMSSSYMEVPPISAQTNHSPCFFSSSMVLARLVTFATGV